MFKKIRNLLVVAMIAAAGALFAAAPVAAQTIDVGVGVNVGTSAIVNGGDSFAFGANASAAECANSFSLLGIVAASWSDRGCKLVKSAVSGYRAGLTSLNEARSIYFDGIALMRNDRQQPRVASAPALPSYRGEWSELTFVQQSEIVACDALWGGRKIRACAGQYYGS